MNNKNNVLIGVDHANEKEEFDSLMSILSGYDFKKAGLEIPKGEFYKIGALEFDFFSKIEETFKQSGIEVIGLDSPVMSDKACGLRIAKNVHSGRIPRKNIEDSLMRNKLMLQGNRSYNSPQNNFYHINLLSKLKTALRILDFTKGNGLEKLWVDLGNLRSKYMLREIRRTNPDLVVVGDNHAQFLSEHLPSFDYIKLRQDGSYQLKHEGEKIDKGRGKCT